jgi:hypothetical protein
MRYVYNADMSTATTPDAPITHDQQWLSWSNYVSSNDQHQLNPYHLIPDRSSFHTSVYLFEYITVSSVLFIIQLVYSFNICICIIDNDWN